MVTIPIAILCDTQDIYEDAEDFLDSDEWMEDDLMLTAHAAASAHDGLKSPPPYPPYSIQSTLTEFGNINTVAPTTKRRQCYLLFVSRKPQIEGNS